MSEMGLTRGGPIMRFRDSRGAFKGISVMAYNDQKIVGVLMEEFERLPVDVLGIGKR